MNNSFDPDFPFTEYGETDTNREEEQSLSLYPYVYPISGDGYGVPQDEEPVSENIPYPSWNSLQEQELTPESRSSYPYTVDGTAKMNASESAYPDPLEFHSPFLVPEYHQDPNASLASIEQVPQMTGDGYLSQDDSYLTQPNRPQWQPLVRTEIPRQSVFSNQQTDLAQPSPIRHVGETKRVLNEKVEIVRRGKWHILVVFFVVFSGIAFFASRMSLNYESFSLLLLDTRETQDVRSDGGFDNPEDPGYANRTLPNQALILGQSLLIAERTADRLLNMGAVQETDQLFSFQEDEEIILTRTELAEILQQDYVSVDPANRGEEADGIKITATSPIPEEAALIANLFAEEYVQYASEISRKHVVATRVFLEEQLERRRTELQTVEAQIEEYQTQEGAVNLTDEAQRAVNQIATLQASLDEARIDESMHKASLRSLEDELRQLRPRLAQRVASGVLKDIEQLQLRIEEKELRLDNIYKHYPDLRAYPHNNADVSALVAEVDQLKAQVQQLSTQYMDEIYASGGVDPRSDDAGITYLSDLNRQIATTRVSLSGSQARIQALEQRIAEYSRRLDVIPMQSNRLAQLQREQQSKEQLYNALTTRMQEARLAEERVKGFAQIIRPATVPEGPVRGRSSTIALGFMLALMLGIGAAVARYKLDSRIYSPDDLKEQGHDLLGIVPDMRRVKRLEFGRRNDVQTGIGIVSTSLLPYLRPLSPAAEAYRRLLTNLRYRNQDTGLRTLVVTSPEMGAGKSVTALNLAITSAQSGTKTLIIDADMHRPSLHEHLSSTPDPVLSRYLFERTAGVSLEHIATGIPNLYALSFKDLVHVPAELLGSQQMNDLILRLRAHFDLIIFDSPPALATTDASLLAAQCDATILVASAEKTDARDLGEAYDELRKVGARMYGTVLNRFNPSRMNSYRNAYKYRDKYYSTNKMPIA